MKTEDFDDAIRKKLEGLDQKYTEQDIDKVVQHVKKNHLWSRGGISSSSLIFTLAAAAVSGILLWYAMRPADDSVEERNPVSVPGMQSGAPLVQNDSSLTDPGIELPSGPASSKPVFYVDRVAEYNLGDRIQRKAESPLTPAGITSDSSKVDDIKGVKVIAPLQVISDVAPDTSSVVSDTFQVIPPSELPGQWIDLIATPVKDSIGQTSGINTGEKMETNEPALPVTGVEKSNEADNQPIPEPEKPPKSGKLTSGKGGFFKTAGFSTGAGFEYTGKSYGIGLKASVSLENRFGLTIGLKYAGLQAEHFNTRDDFNHHGHHRKNHRLEEHLDGHDHATAIEIQSSLLHLPVSINYTFPLPANFGLGLSVGTDLDLLLNQRMRFDHGPDSLGPPRREDFRAKGDAALFNNLVFSIGLEKNWKKMTFQLQPFIRPKVKELFYKPGGPEYGLGFGVIYKFGR